MQTETTKAETFCEVTIAGSSGHTSLEFRKDGVVLDWSKTSKPERAMLTKMIEDARAKGFETFTLDDDDQPEALTDKLPGVFFNRKGRMLLKCDEVPKIKIFAKDLIDAQMEGGKMVMEAGDNSEWKILRVGDFELKTEKVKDEKPAKKQVVHVADKKAGG